MTKTPKLSVWKRVISEVSAHHHVSAPPGIPSSADDSWTRERAWSQTTQWMRENGGFGIVSALGDEDFVPKQTFQASEVSADDFAGEIGEKLRAVHGEHGWTKRKRQLVSELKECLARSGYIEINGHGVRYLVSHVGGSFIYRVPVSQKGHLRPFRGKTIRVVCTGSGTRSYRTYMVGVAG